MEQMIDHIKSWLEEAGEKIKSNGSSDKCRPKHPEFSNRKNPFL